MPDPVRLLNSSSGQHQLERAVLDSLRVVTVPAQAKGVVWGALSVTVAEAGALAGATAGTASAWQGAFKLLVSPKALLAVPAVVAALSAGAVMHQHSQAASALSTSVASVSSVSSDALTAAQPSPSEPSSEAEAPLPDTADRPAPVVVRDRLRHESALLTRARAELRSGNPHAAQATLSRMQREFPAGALRQERDVLGIEALAAEGNTEAAARGARAFIALHPESPHAATLHRFLASN
jgi:Outer membrane lipoprotein